MIKKFMAGCEEMLFPHHFTPLNGSSAAFTLKNNNKITFLHHYDLTVVLRYLFSISFYLDSIQQRQVSYLQVGSSQVCTRINDFGSPIIEIAAINFLRVKTRHLPPQASSWLIFGLKGGLGPQFGWTPLIVSPYLALHVTFSIATLFINE